jgi:nitrite reductase/ring-hydroxylating ferredoxin subunit
MAKHVVAAADDIPPGSRKLFTVKGRPVVIFNVAGEYFGLLNRCPHQGGNLCEGKLTGLLEAAEPGQYRYSRQGEILRCPWHGWEFDVRTGQSYCEPDKIKARKFDVSLTEGRTIVEGPYVAETFPVAVEGHYVVVTM